MTHEAICPICGTVFDTERSNKKSCSDECAYINNYINRNAAKEMTREEAIIHYRTLYRDRLLRGLGRSRYIPRLKHILKFCQLHNRMTFTCAEVAKDCPERLTPNTLGAIKRRHGKVIQQIYAGHPGDPSIWEFTLPEEKPYRVGRLSYY